MSRNLARDTCYYCGDKPTVDEDGGTTHGHRNATCQTCGAKYITYGIFGIDNDLSFRHSFNDEPDPEDLPVWEIVGRTPLRMPWKTHDDLGNLTSYLGDGMLNGKPVLKDGMTGLQRYLARRDVQAARSWIESSDDPELVRWSPGKPTAKDVGSHFWMTHRGSKLISMVQIRMVGLWLVGVFSGGEGSWRLDSKVFRGSLWIPVPVPTNLGLKK